MKSQKIIIVLLFLIMGTTFMLSACGGTFSGRVAVKGNEPFTYLTLVTDKGDMKIIGPLEKKLQESFQGMRVTVKGTIVNEGRGFMALPELEVSELVNADN